MLFDFAYFVSFCKFLYYSAYNKQNLLSTSLPYLPFEDFLKTGSG